jgi:hypothetical protein
MGLVFFGALVGGAELVRVNLTKSPWSECSSPNLTLTDAASACGPMTARHRRFA